MINAGSSRECIWDGSLTFHILFPFFSSLKSFRQLFPFCYLPLLGVNKIHFLVRVLGWYPSLMDRIDWLPLFWVLSFCYVSYFNKVTVGYYHSTASHLNFFCLLWSSRHISSAVGFTFIYLNFQVLVGYGRCLLDGYFLCFMRMNTLSHILMRLKIFCSFYYRKWTWFIQYSR